MNYNSFVLILIVVDDGLVQYKALLEQLVQLKS